MQAFTTVSQDSPVLSPSKASSGAIGSWGSIETLEENTLCTFRSGWEVQVKRRGQHLLWLLELAPDFLPSSSAQSRRPPPVSSFPPSPAALVKHTHFLDIFPPASKEPLISFICPSFVRSFIYSFNTQ